MDEVGEDLAAEGVLQARHEPAEREASVSEHRRQAAQRRCAGPDARRPAGRSLLGAERGRRGQEARSARANSRIAARSAREVLEQARLEPVDVRVDGDDPAVRHHDRAEIVGVVERAVVDDADVAPEAIDRRLRRRAGESRDAAVEQVALAPPRRAEAAGRLSHLEDGGAVAAPRRVAARGEPCHASADDHEW